MQHAPPIEALQRQLRSQICRRCYLRPSGSDAARSDTPRACERWCAIFTTLPQARQVGGFTDPMLGSYEKVLRHLYHNVCTRPPSAAAAHCDTRALHRYQKRVVEALTGMFGRGD